MDTTETRAPATPPTGDGPEDTPVCKGRRSVFRGKIVDVGVERVRLPTAATAPYCSADALP
jgi:hypothetical protein